MLHIIQGGVPDRILFTPRLDIWYNYNRNNHSLPTEYENLSLQEITSKLGLGLHSVIPDFIRPTEPEDVYHRGLGFYNHHNFPYKVDFGLVDFNVEKSEDEIKVIYHTQYGNITCRFNYGPELFNSGISIPDILEHPIKKEDDYRVLKEIFSNVRIIPTPENYKQYYDRVGNSGIAVAFTSLASGPMQHVMRDLIKFDQFCMDILNESAGLFDLVESLEGLYNQIIDSTLVTPAEVVLFGANYDETITYEPFFREHIAPWLNRAAKKMESAGKFLSTHTDGENKGLLSAFRDCKFDIADSVCPAPMTKLSLEDYRSFFGDRTTIWGGIPSVIMLKSSFSYEDFKDYINNILIRTKPYDHLILSIADTTPPGSDFGRLEYIIEKCSQAKTSG